MVFEAIVVELLNKFLKQYVENLDTSQLKIGIWGGDVVLKDLKVKTTIFDDWNLPVRVKWGKLGKFAMKIPWQNLYSGQVSVNVEDLLVVIIPNSEFIYDPVKEEKWAFERKQAKLKEIEEARKKELDPESATEQDSFIEKLLTQIIKNIHIVISNIHVRYEDKTTIPNSPVSIGVTLANLSAITTATDPSGHFTKMLRENKNFICKLLNLEGLSIYWNSNSDLYSSLSAKEITKILTEMIPKPNFKPRNMMYMFGPLTSSAFLRLNPKPEIDGTNFNVPKIFVQILLKEIDLAVTHNQFCDFMDLLDDSRRLHAANKFKKYRPVGIPVKNHAKEWWHFAYKCVSEDIIRRKSEWKWENIKNHRRMGKRYSELYKNKLNMKKMTQENTHELNSLEKTLSLLNLILIREQVHMEVERDKLNESKQETRKGGWFSGWFSSNKTSVDMSGNSDELVKKIESVLTPTEKAKLFKAIGYEENAPFAKYPPTFVEFQFWFHLEEIKMSLYDDRSNHLISIMTVSVKDVRTEFERRSSANAHKLVAVIGNFQVIGKADKAGKVPELVISNCKKSESLVELLWETKPLDKSCDHCILVNALPLRIIYHAKTINRVRETFTVKNVKEVEKIVSATSASLPTFQKITSLGLQYAIEKRAILEVKINVKSSHIIIPYEGEYHHDKDMLVIILGSVSVETENNGQKDVSVKKLYLEGTTDEEIFSTVVSASYTDFKFRLTGVQILFQLSGEDWVAASKVKGPSSMRFLESTNLDIDFKKSLVTDDPRIPKIIIRGILPNLTFNLSEKRVISLVALICSIPMKTESTTSKRPPSTWSLQSLGANLENKLKDIPLMKPVVEFTQGIDLVAQFEVKALIVNVSKTKGTSHMLRKEKPSEEEKFLKLQVTQMEVDLTSKTFEALYLLKITGISFDHHKQNDVVSVLSCTGYDKNHYLLTVEYVNLNTKIPDFFTTRQGVVNRLTITTASLNVLINKEALLAELQFVRHIQMRVDAVKREMEMDRVGDIGKYLEEEFEMAGKDEKKVISRGKRFRKKSEKEVIDLLLVVVLENISVNVDFEDRRLCQFSLRGTKLNIANRKSSVNLDFTLKEIFLLDLNPLTVHEKIIASLEEQTLSSRITLYNKDYFGNENSVDSSIEAEVSLIQLTFVNIFFARAFEFLSAFQSQIESLKEGASVAAQRAKENLISAYQNQAQVCLNIQITAPILVVPKLSTSFDAIILDMGVLTMKNTIQELDIILEKDTVGKTPLIDTIKCHLQNLKMIRRSSNKSYDLINFEKMFVLPVTLEINLKRNLSLSWFRGIPDVEINTHLGAIHIKLTHSDIRAIVGILRGNINESLEAWDYERSTPMKSGRKPTKEKEMKAGHSSIHSEEMREVKELPVAMNHVVIKFVFSMDSVRFDAINDKEDGTEESEGLATFILETISLKGTMYSDRSVQMFIILVSCILDDTRPGNVGRLTRLMERTVDFYSFQGLDESNMIHSMIQIKYTKDDLGSFVDVKVYKFTLILSMDFLHKLWEFFSIDEPVPINVESKSKQSPKGEETVFIEHTPTFTLNIRLEKPDIIMVESMDSIDTDALVFHAEMVSKLRLAGSRQIINATLTDIEVYSCCFNPARRPFTLSQVIKPFTISVAGSTPEDRGLHVDICLTEVAITINPQTIDLLSKCYKALFKDPLINQVTPQEVDHSDLWEVKEFNMDDYWFLKPEKGIDALTHRRSSISDVIECTTNEQVCLVSVPCILLYIEGRTVKRSIPLLMIEMGFQMQCYNWSHKLSINSSLTLQMEYYNRSQTSWEPLIEPVEVNPEKEEIHSYTPWELICTVETEEEGEIDFFQPPKFQVTLSCVDILQLTITKTGLKVLQTALDWFTSPVKQEIVKTSTRETAPIVVINKTGLKVDVMLQDSQLEVWTSMDESYETVTLNTDSELELQVISTLPGRRRHKLRRPTIKLELDSTLHIKFPLCSKKVFQLPLGMSSKRYYPFQVDEKEFRGKEVWGLVSDIYVEDNTTKITLRSIVRIRNGFNEPVNIYVLSENEEETHFVGTAERNSFFPLPFQAVYNKKKLLFFTVHGYSLSTKPFQWEQIKNELNTSDVLQCDSKTPENNDPFFIQVVGETEHIYYTNTKRKTVSSVCYIIHLEPTVKIFNSLPVPLSICFQGVAKEKSLLPGNTIQITNAEPGLSTVTVMIYDYLEKNWSCKENIQENPPEYLIWKFTSYNGLQPENLNLGVRVTHKRKTAVYAIYCPYFMVNKTEYLLAYKFEGNSSVVYHPGDHKPPVMFTPPQKKFFSKKFAYLQVGHSNWSDKFPVDVAGSGGTIECEDHEKNKVYMVSVTINLTKNSLTKIVTFTPYYIFVNSAPYDIELIECHLKDNHWLNIPTGSCVPFWPQSREKEKTIKIRPKGFSSVSPPFAYRSTDSILLRLDHKYGGIFVDIQATNSGTYIMFQQYENGQAPVLIINDSAKTIVIGEKDTKHTTTLQPKQQVFYAWIAPTKGRQLFVKNSKHSKEFLVINKEETGRIFTGHGTAIRYVSFLDGPQRTLLLTEEENLVRNLNSIKTTMPSGVELVCKINGIGLSLVNDLTRVEILYLSFISTTTSWEVKKPGKRRFVKMKDEKIHKLEAAYQKYLDDLDVQEAVNPIVSVTEKLLVDFENMVVVSPHHKKNKQLRRVFEPGLWGLYRYIDGQVMIHVKINRVQMDNQLLDCVFPIVLIPVPPPKTIVAELKGPKSFFELSILKTSEEYTGIAQYKYFKILVQEFHVKVDIGFIQNLYDFMAQGETVDEEEKEKFRQELELTERGLLAHVQLGSSTGRKNFYELLHFSPLKIHFSFSLAGTFDSGGALPPTLSAIFQSLGVTLTDMHDVIFRLSFFEKKSAFLSQKQLVNEVISHYYGQTIRQAYVLLLGLDVIGNPFGLIVGIGEGVEAFFYEPFQGIVQGPSDFAAGVAIGCKRFFKGTVGSTAGTLEKLTGTLGKGLAALSLDKDYQMQRIENAQREETIQAAMARGGKDLFMGVFDGLTGVVKKPIAGAKEEGVGGFFKGMGKGMMGLVTRPVTGVVDFASTSLNAVKRAAVGIYGVKRVRPPRFFRDECLVQPYNFYDAKGNLLLYSLCKRRYCKTDKYEYFYEIKNKEYVILTNKRIILAEFNDTFETWQEHMAILWQSMPDCPRYHSKGVALTLRCKSKKRNLMDAKPEVKILLIEDAVVKERMFKKMVELYNLEIEQEFFR